MKRVDYRKIYEDYYKTKIPTGYDIHHIDLDHSNNNPLNLVALPSDIHHILHERYNTFASFCPHNLQLHTSQANNITDYHHALYDYVQVLNYCEQYMYEREVLQYARKRF